MNIKQAKEQVKNAMTAYFSKDEFGEYEIPLARQRPIFLMGPPGIGKTAIMEQIAQELGVGLVSYSMTHHTRQSALGLPYIEKKNYGGKEYSVSEYTMSEIIASVYEMMEETGVKEGILFLDEINCVSETLAPAMLQFLQFKIFGRHRVPDGWIVVTAGNPPEYNDSVREFDIVTWDRLKRIDVEPDYKAWKEYASQSCVHPSVTTYLDIKESDFYRIETGVDGKTFVTARGWSDLSEMIRLYEKRGIQVDESLVIQYLQNREVAKNFALYYDLFNKYKSDYQIDKILAGDADDTIKTRAKEARFDERLSLLGLLLGALSEAFRGVRVGEQVNERLLQTLKSLRPALAENDTALLGEIKRLREQRVSGRRSNSLSADEQTVLNHVVVALEETRQRLEVEGGDAFALLKADFDKRTAQLKTDAAEVGRKLENAFDFCENAFGEGHELLIFVTELTANTDSARFIGRYGSEGYYRHNKELLFYERQKEILKDIDALASDLT